MLYSTIFIFVVANETLSVGEEGAIRPISGDTLFNYGCFLLDYNVRVVVIAAVRPTLAERLHQRLNQRVHG